MSRLLTIRRLTLALAALAFALTATLATLSSSPAVAADSGGDGAATSCANGITVKSTKIYGTRGPVRGKAIGELQLRWSWACHGQWSRVVLYGGMYPNSVTVEQVVESEGRRANSTDFVRPGTSGTSAWTRYLRLRNSSSTACAQVWLSSDFGSLSFHTVGARICA